MKALMLRSSHEVMDKPDLPSNFATCKGRTLTLVNKLRKSPELLQLYDGIIKEQERRGFIYTAKINSKAFAIPILTASGL